ncbi:MAG: preprotein translocase subunit SecA [Gammaproteobacteria bacterium]
MANILSKLFGSRNKRLLKTSGKVVKKANALEEEYKSLSDEALGGKTAEFRARLKDGESLDSMIHEAFAAVREAAWRTLGMRHYDVQLIGGLTLHDNQIAEMRTGEGKTLVATLPVYVNALLERGVHVVTVNEYLAARDANWMRPVYEFLGLSVGIIQSDQDRSEKQAAYNSDVTYGTNNEFGFDYLRDNLAFRLEDKVQRELAFAIVDEVDSILIDEARTPLIISGPSDESPEMYAKINLLVPKLTVQTEEDGPGDYSVDEKSKQVHLTEEGQENAEAAMSAAGLIKAGDSLFDAANIGLMHYLNAGLRAHALFKRDVDYIVQEGEIVIVDEFTGRTMPGRRWSDGLHQAIEAKEKVNVKQESQTFASITFQNYFRMYEKLGGMTGTADTEAYEFQQIYGLEVLVIPTHKPMIRDDQTDLVYLTRNDKFEAIIEDIQRCVEEGQPALVGTTSIETSEDLAKMMKSKSIKHEVLNAKQHEREAEIVAQAGRPGSITIATNMAGRGTDIVLGGNLEAELATIPEDDDAARAAAKQQWKERHDAVKEAGGLHIIGTERHESRRIDNQLRGRSGRQGDPGSSRFFLSMEDNLMRIFGDPENIKRMLGRVGMREGEAIESNMLGKQIERAQRKVETHHFDARKNLLEYDDVANDQRKVIYLQRSELMHTDDMSDSIVGIREEVIHDIVQEHIPDGSMEEQWSVGDLEQIVESEFGLQCEIKQWLESDSSLKGEGVAQRILEALEGSYNEKVELHGDGVMRHLEKAVMLQQLDSHWKEHLAALDFLRQGIHLRGYAQKNPKQEYKREAFQMFSDMLDRFKRETVTILSRVQIREREDVDAMQPEAPAPTKLRFKHDEAQAAAAPPAAAAAAPQPQRPVRPVAGPGGQPGQPAAPFQRNQPKVGRNEPCPCGSGKKYKQCHGKIS